MYAVVLGARAMQRKMSSSDGFNIDVLERCLDVPGPEATFGDIGEGIAARRMACQQTSCEARDRQSKKAGKATFS
jgi:hypothetical protein